jgi:hypothetical protein
VADDVFCALMMRQVVEDWLRVQTYMKDSNFKIDKINR